MDKLIFLPPPLIALLLAGTGIGLDHLLPELPSLALPGLGVVMMAAGFFLLISALLSFRSFRTTVIPHGDPSALITLGPYLWTRNPIYLGLTTVLFGFTLYFGGLAIFLAPPVLAGLLGRIHIPHEEAKLSSRFGDAYEAYRQRVARWL